MNTKTGLKLIKIHLVHSAPLLVNNKKQTTLDFPSTSKITESIESTESTESVGGLKEGKTADNYIFYSQ